MRLGWVIDFVVVAPHQYLRRDGARSGSIGAIGQNFQSISIRQINQIRETARLPVWQRNYYERIIQDDRASQHIRQYSDNI